MLVSLLKPLLGPVCILLSYGVFALVVKHRLNQDKTRPPRAFRVQRGPGYSLREKRDELYDELLISLVLGPVMPIVVAYSMLLLLERRFSRSDELLIYGIPTLVFLLGSFLVAARLYKKMEVIRNYTLGYKGELDAAHHLEPLKKKGYRVFHDLPAVENGSSFNIDHIVVGPTGVFVIETKARRKGRARPGFKDYEVSFDGERLIWPWGEDDWGLRQTYRQSKWLEKRIETLTGEKILIKPILNFPGWWVKEMKLSRIRVINSKNLALAIEGKRGAAPVLDSRQVGLLNRQFEEACGIDLNEQQAN